MRKMVILVVGGVGFILGSRSGRQPYEQLEAQLRRVQRKPKVQQAAHSIKEEVADRKSDLAHKAKAKVDEAKAKVASSDAGSIESNWPEAGAAV